MRQHGLLGTGFDLVGDQEDSLRGWVKEALRPARLAVGCQIDVLGYQRLPGHHPMNHQQTL